MPDQQPLSGFTDATAGNDPAANLGMNQPKADPNAAKAVGQEQGNLDLPPVPEAKMAPSDNAPAINAPQEQTPPTPYQPPNFAPPTPPQPEPTGKGEMKELINSHLAADPNWQANAHKADGFMDALTAGLQISVSGLRARGQMPDTVLPENAGLLAKIAETLGQTAGDLPAMAMGAEGGGAAGTMAGAAIGAATGPGFIGTAIAGGAIGGAMGAFATPAAIRKMYIDHYTRGDMADADDPRQEFVSRLMGTAWETIKGATTGAAASMSAGLAAPLGKVAATASELAAMTTVGAALEKRLPTVDDFITGGILLGGMKAATGGFSSPELGASKAPGELQGTIEPSKPTAVDSLEPEEKLKNIWANSGTEPHEVLDKMKDDAILTQQVLAGNAQEPPQASPSSIEMPSLSSNVEGEKPPLPLILPKTESELGGESEAPKEETEIPTSRGEIQTFTKEDGLGYDREYQLKQNVFDPKGLSNAVNETPVETTEVKNGKQIKIQLADIGGHPHIIARDLEGTVAGTIQLSLEPINSPATSEEVQNNTEKSQLTSAWSEVAPDFRRQGVASAMYDFVDKHIGELQPSRIQLADGREFWEDRSAKKAAAEVTPEDIDNARKQIEASRGETPKAPKQTFGEMLSDFYKDQVDYFKGWNAKIKQAIKGGAVLTPENNPVNIARSARNGMATAFSFLADGTRDAKTGDINGEGMKAIFDDMEKAGLDKDEFRNYADAANAVKEFENGRTGVIPKEAAKTFYDAFKDKYQPYLKRLNQFQQRVTQYAEDKGLYPKGTAAELAKNDDYYNPQHRVFNLDELDYTGERGSARIVARTESDRLITDSLKQRALNVQKTITAALHNEAYRSMIDFLDKGKMVDKGGAPKVEGAEAPVLTKENTFTGTRVDEAGEKTAIHRAPLANEISIRREGVRETYSGDKEFIDEIKRLQGDNQQLNIVGKALKGVRDFVRFTTVANPLFALGHIAKEQISAGIQSQTGYIPFYHLAGGLADFMMDSEGFKKFVSEGGAGNLYLQNAQDDFMNRISTFGDKPPSFLKQSWNLLTSPLHMSEAMIRSANSATKFQEWHRSVNEGLGKQEAMANTRLIAPDYSNMGLRQSAVRNSTAFLSAHINSMDTTVKAFNADPSGFMRRSAYMAGFSALVWALNKDDDAIQSQPQWKRDMSWMFNLSRMDPNYDGKNALIATMPKNWMQGIAVAGTVEHVLDAYFKDRPDEFPAFLKTLAGSVMPEVFSTFAQPILEQWANKNAHTGKPLVYENKFKEGLPEYEYAPWSSPTAAKIGRMIGYIPGANNLINPQAPLSNPAIVQNYVSKWSGVVGSTALKSLDASSGEADRSSSPSIYESRFLTRYPNYGDQNVMDFKNELAQANKAAMSQNTALKAGDENTYNRIQSQYRPDQTLDVLNQFHGTITDADKEIRRIESDKDLTSTDKQQTLDRAYLDRGQAAKAAMEMLRDFRRKNL